MARFYNMYLVSAFTDGPFKGNSTGVIIDKGDLSPQEKQNIAKDIKQPVSVFIKRLDTGVYNTEFYTPEKEIQLCGHATMATFYALAENEYILPQEEGIQKITQYTKAGKIKVELEYRDIKIKHIFMTLKLRNEEKIKDFSEILDILNLKKEDVGLEICNCYPEKISTGLGDIIIPVKNEEILNKIKLDIDRAIEFSERENIISFNVFTTKDGENTTQRTFSPIIGMNEEMGSGTSTAATMYYLHNNLRKKPNIIYSNQGKFLGRISKIIAEYNEVTNDVKVGGRAYSFMNGVLKI